MGYQERRAPHREYTICIRQQFVNQHDDQHNQNQVTIIVSLATVIQFNKRNLTQPLLRKESK